jgi:ADP-ribose pyrophosphatase
MHRDLQRPINVSNGEVLHKDPFQTLSKFRAVFDGFHKDYFVVDRGSCAAVLVVDKKKILLVKQYRFVVDKITSELPSGGIEKGESPEIAAIRECREEAGVECRSLKPLVEYHTGVDTFKHHARIFVCEDFLTIDPSSERREWVPIEDCVEWIFSGRIVDSLSIIAILGYWTRSKR